MKKYEKTIIEENILTKVYCNKCGKAIDHEVIRGKSDYISIEKEWGYFSNKDMEVHSFDICEACYDEFINSFKIPPKQKKVNNII